MGQLDNLPMDSQPQGHQSAEAVLQAITKNLSGLQQTLAGQLSQDIERLQERKQQLLQDVESLEADYDQLQTRYRGLKEGCDAVLTQQQQAQQQLWAKRLAQALATNLYSRLTADLSPAIANNSGLPNLPQTQQVLASLDTSLQTTLQSLQQDLNSYQSALSQQIGRMHSMEHQGEAILEALINRLSQQLQTQMVQPQISAMAQPSAYANGESGIHLPPMAASGYPAQARWSAPHYNGYGQQTHTPVQPQPSRPPALSGAPTSDKPSTPFPSGLSSLQKGLIFIVLSTLALSVHNVLVGIIGYGGEIFGRFPVQGIFPLEIPNSLMLLWLRMVVVLPLMAIVAPQLYPDIWRDIRNFLQGEDRRPVLQVIASGGFLFMSQVLIYKSISDIGPGVAVTLLFMYPLLTVPLAWFLFGDRPTPLRLVVMFAISMGIVFTALPRINLDLAGGSVSVWGVAAAILSSAAFAFYLVSMQLSFRRLHPVPVSFLQFCTIFVLTSSILIVGKFLGMEPGEPSSQSGLYLGGIILGALTLMGYLCNNYGVRLMGAAQASIVASSGPVITAILAYFITPGEKSALQFIQWIGVVLVTLGVVSLSLERLATSRRQAKRKQLS